MTGARRVVELPLDLILVPTRLREVDPLQVEALKESIAERGLLAPVVVTAPDAAGRHTLIAGLHRLRAVEGLGWPKIEALVHAVVDADHARLLEIEENLIRHDLNDLDRAIFLAEWKRIYNAMTGARGRGRPKKEETSEFPLRFSEAVKERLKLTPRAVDMAVRRASITNPLRRVLIGHPVTENGSVLDLIAKLTVEQQETLAAELTPAWSVAQVRGRVHEMLGRALAAGRGVCEQLVALWKRASDDEKAEFRRHIAARGQGSKHGEPR